MGPAKFVLFPKFGGEKQIKEKKDGENGIQNFNLETARKMTICKTRLRQTKLRTELNAVILWNAMTDSPVA
jgi:hypothetical protein